MRNDVDRLTEAVVRLCAEHGIPNKFSAGEIALESGLPLLTVGKLLSQAQRKHGPMTHRKFTATYGKEPDGLSYLSIEKQC